MNNEPLPVPPRKFQLRRWQTYALEAGSFALDELIKKAKSGDLDMDDELSEHNGRWTQAGKQSKLFGLQADRYKFVNANKSLSLLTDKVRNNQLTSERYLHLRGQAFDAGSDLQAKAIVDDFISNLGGSANKTMIGSPETPATMVGDSHPFATMTGDSLNPATLVGDLRPFATMTGDSLNPATMGGSPVRTMVGKAVGLVPGDIVHDSRQPRYEVIDKLGEGGQGAVYKVKDLRFEGMVKAIKIQDPIQSCKEALKARFMREGLAGNIIQHPNVVRVDDAKDDEVRELVYLVMEFVDGGSLRDLINANPKGMEVQVVLNLIQSILDGLQAIHKCPYIHKDIKPENILIEKRGNLLVPKIADLGLAGIGDITGAVGTFDYMAPEQNKGSAGITPSADLYALGKIFYELLTGQRPELGGEPLGSLRPDAVRFELVYRKSIKKNSEERYRNCDEFMIALKLADSVVAVPEKEIILEERKSVSRVIIHNPFSETDFELSVSLPAFDQFLLLKAERNESKAMVTLAHQIYKWANENEGADEQKQGLIYAGYWFERAANAGNGEAMRMLGKMCLRYELLESYSEAGIWFQKASHAADAEGMFEYSKSFFDADGEIVLGQDVECRDWMNKASELNFIDALNWKGLHQLYGTKPYSQDQREACECFKRSAKQDSSEGVFRLGLCLLNGWGVAQSTREAFELFSKAEKLGHTAARTELANCYLEGIGIEPHQIRAFKLFKENAMENDVYSMGMVGQCLLEGRGVEKSEIEAMPWLRRAAEVGESEAMFLLADCYSRGIGSVHVDEFAASEWYIKSAEANFTKAKFEAGERLFLGKGVDRDYEKSKVYLEQYLESHLNSELGPQAQFRLGFLYEYGLGCDFDMSKALSFYESSSQNRNPFARQRLAYAFFAGNGVTKDLAEASSWAESARSVGLPLVEYDELISRIHAQKASDEITGKQFAYEQERKKIINIGVKVGSVLIGLLVLAWWLNSAWGLLCITIAVAVTILVIQQSTKKYPQFIPALIESTQVLDAKALGYIGATLVVLFGLAYLFHNGFSLLFICVAALILFVTVIRLIQQWTKN